MNTNEIITLVTGGNRGMGLEVVKELSQKGQRVIMGSRNLEKGKAAIAQLAQIEIKADLVQLDVTDPISVSKAAQIITDKYGYLTILINNAGAVFDFQQKPSEVKLTNLRADFEINYFGLVDVTQKMLPLLKKSSKAKIINISSIMGSKTETLNPKANVYHAVAVGYQSAKAAANMYTVQLAKEMSSANLPITVNAIDPGMVATEFGGATPELVKKLGAKPVSFGIARTIELATSPNNQATATFTNTYGTVAW
ncbi:SDR family NAD(P)-dependent oxidoreductase [Loigolactobacillus backii]|uniref:SDR family NAD(P)-dependent oxidoreductase n=1 Tax=Loigolactobacillus backii TaxID=375175 RepID=UPI0007F13896|nr:SDR family NAD(P)-dependent oxidoreductase [Loigolactobacillus backii]ANK67749.1 carbonyl reductase [Loigolactobacillus backii]OLF70493.1 carbonyl reductase [Loigolactobacillus backii]PIO87025.1 carbonyl reductase [Loigolactobacillus backii]